jgi:hypothetical protein
LGVGGARSVVLRQHSGGERSRRRNRSPRSELPSCGRPIPLLPQRPVRLAPLQRGFSLCPNIGNHLPRSRSCFGAEERNSPRVIIGKASPPSGREGGFLDPNRAVRSVARANPSLRPGVRPVRAPEPPAPAAITRLQVLLAWDDRIANGRIAPAIAIGEQA